MAKKTTKYELSRADISEAIQDLIGKLEDAEVQHTTPSAMEDVLSDVIGDLEGLADDVKTKA